MTVSLSGNDLARTIGARLPQAVIEANDKWVLVRRESIAQFANFLKSDPELAFDYLNYVTAVDYHDYFELVYQFTAMKDNRQVVVKTRCPRNDATVPSITPVYRGADLQEREIFDLMGIKFEGHPNLKRIFLWEGFQGFPLRKDYL
jgi:NADH/F420H2 dehydrogenase subunit C